MHSLPLNHVFQCSISYTTAADHLLKTILVFRIVSSRDQFYKHFTTTTVNYVCNKIRSNGYWIHASVHCHTRYGTVYAPMQFLIVYDATAVSYECKKLMKLATEFQPSWSGPGKDVDWESRLLHQELNKGANVINSFLLRHWCYRQIS